jgi:hypothetical protein
VVDKGIAGLATTEVMTGVALPVALPVVLPVVLLVTTADVLEFDTMDDAKRIGEAKGGGGTALAGSTSLPIPQEILLPSG